MKNIDEAKATAMIDDALGQAVYYAPCINSPEFAHRGMAKSILRGAILRWNEAGTGAVQSQTTLSYGQTIDTRQPRKAMFFQSEIDQLKALCRSDDTGGAFNIDTLPASVTQHALACDLRLGGTTCSCGANLTGAAGYPLWENHPDDGWG
ncbi:hypothetical protein [Mycolicibacterium komossense]|uniref:hypothetical protein n=1 Tax=Mycolicibacterium komossense TaxID=1779 RepID=UPI0021F32337|nr:hypothetical protein [Mycolicibacterium komossense]